MNILVIGNGFDLAHGLPTKYTHFLDWVRSILKIGDRLAWVDEIPLEAEEAKKWLDDESLPEKWEVEKEAEHESMNDIRRDSEDDYKNKKVETNNALESIIVALKYLKKEKKIDEIDCAEDFFLQLRDVLLQKDKLDEGSEIKAVRDYKKYKKEQYVYKHLVYLPKKIFYLVKCNFWISYFMDMSKDNQDTWIDFEKEISTVIRCCVNKGTGEHTKYVFPSYLQGYMINISITGSRNDKYVIDRLEYDLNRLILLLEIYLAEYVEKDFSPASLQDIDEIKIDHVLSFNYTHTFLNIYRKQKGIKEKDIDYVHGEVKTDFPMEYNNMVLGIDEYLPEERKDKEIDFIFFKKYYQRLYKDTGIEYKKWIDRIKENAKFANAKSKREPLFGDIYRIFEKHFKHNIYFFGHSLDVTDKDILRELILNDNVHTTIFYRNKVHKRELITNLVKVIGQDELIRRTRGQTRTIEFRLQRNK